MSMFNLKKLINSLDSLFSDPTKTAVGAAIALTAVITAESDVRASLSAFAFWVCIYYTAEGFKRLLKQKDSD